MKFGDKFTINILKGATFTIWGGLGTFVCIEIANNIAKSYHHSDSWDALAFTGSIIGGAITLIGIRITILNQRKEEFLKNFPERLVNADDIFDKVSELSGNMWEDNSDEIEEEKRVIQVLDEFIESENQIKKQAIVVSIEFYHVIKTLFDSVKWLRSKLELKFYDQLEKSDFRNKFISELGDLRIKLVILKAKMEADHDNSK